MAEPPRMHHNRYWCINCMAWGVACEIQHLSRTLTLVEISGPKLDVVCLLHRTAIASYHRVPSNSDCHCGLRFRAILAIRHFIDQIEFTLPVLCFNWGAQQTPSREFARRQSANKVGPMMCSLSKGFLTPMHFLSFEDCLYDLQGIHLQFLQVV